MFGVKKSTIVFKWSIILQAVGGSMRLLFLNVVRGSPGCKKKSKLEMLSS